MYKETKEGGHEVLKVLSYLYIQILVGKQQNNKFTRDDAKTRQAIFVNPTQ